MFCLLNMINSHSIRNKNITSISNILLYVSKSCWSTNRLWESQNILPADVGAMSDFLSAFSSKTYQLLIKGEECSLIKYNFSLCTFKKKENSTKHITIQILFITKSSLKSRVSNFNITRFSTPPFHCTSWRMNQGK